MKSPKLIIYCVSFFLFLNEWTILKHLFISTLSAECAAWSGDLCLYTGAVALGTSPAGDAGKHRGYEWGESLDKEERMREGWRGGVQGGVCETKGQMDDYGHEE